MSIKINLSYIFKACENKQYSIIKIPKCFPEYSIGSDLDIFCYDILAISHIIVLKLREYVSETITIEIHNFNNSQIHIDLVAAGEVHLRFDLYAQLPKYENLRIKPSFFPSIIENSTSILIDNILVKVPCEMDEAILRYIEYQEWYSQRPDKIKHVEYLENKISKGEIDVEKLYDKLHYYTEVPRVKYDFSKINNKFSISEKYKNLVKSLLYKKTLLMKYLKDYGFKATIILIKDKLFK